MFVYHQIDGHMMRDGALVGVGYSGHGDGLNNPGMEAVHGVGPIPRGKYRIGPWHDHFRPQYGHSLGACVAQLLPVGHDAHGRTELFEHGDNDAMNHTASDGCIIMGKLIRQAMRDSGDHDLTVV